MNKTNNPKLTGISKTLRKNMTKEERHLWYDYLKGLTVTVNRQKVIGNYIADFYIASSKIVIEIDGIQHSFDEQADKDVARDEYFSSLGLLVLRYTNYEINKEFKRVCKEIGDTVEVYRLDKQPSPRGEGVSKADG